MPEAFSLFKQDMKKKIFKIKLLTDESLLEGILDYCDEKDINKLNDQQYIVNFDFIDDDYGYGILLSLAYKCICLEPEHVRTEMIQRTEKLANCYSKNLNDPSKAKQYFM